MGFLSTLFGLRPKRGATHKDILSDLYALRRGIAEDRQKGCLTEYDQLHMFFVSLKVGDQPYNLSFGDKFKFRGVAFYPNNVFGAPARVPDKEKYLYRICNMMDVVKGTGWLDPKEGSIPNWNQVYSKGKGDWVALSRLARGSYLCEPRHFSWWTTFPLFEDVIGGAHQIGMTNDWVAEHSVVLRCPVEYVKSSGSAYVPSVIDAYTQMIFHPTKSASSPAHGVTVNLSMYPTLAPGIDEVLLPALPVDVLDILPVYVDDWYRRGKNAVNSDWPELHGLLKSYYENMR
jgi:hypothetical protein